MDRSSKRALAFILALLMVLSIVPGYAFSAGTEFITAEQDGEIKDTENTKDAESYSLIQNEEDADTAISVADEAYSANALDPVSEEADAEAELNRADVSASLPHVIIEGHDVSEISTDSDVSEGAIDETSEDKDIINEDMTTGAALVTTEGAVENTFEPQAVNYFTVSFDVPNNVPGFSEQIVTEGAFARHPGNALLPEPNPDNLVSFLGWYEEGAQDSEPYTFDKPVTEDLTIYARYRTYYILNYINAFGVVFISKILDHGDIAPQLTMDEMSQFSAPAGEYFDHWELLDEYGNSIREFSLGSEIVDRDINIRGATAVNRSYVFFVSEGTQVPFQIVATGGFAVEPDDIPIRLGYTFDYWTDNEGKRFVFNDTAITSDTTLYAKWIAEKTNFEIVFWKEKANISGDPIIRDPQTGKLNAAQPNFIYQTSFTEVTYSGLSIDQAGLDAVIGAHADSYPLYSTYTHGDYTSNAETILGNGTTIVNVYFKKNIYTVYFYIGNNELNKVETGLNSEWTSGLSSRYSMQVGGSTYYWTDLFIYPKKGEPSTNYTLDPKSPEALSKIKNGNHYYIQAKYEDYIADRWPRLVDINKDLSGTSPGRPYKPIRLIPPFPTATSSDLEGEGWATPRVTFEAEMIPPYGDTEYIVYADWSSTVKRVNVHYYIEDIDGSSGIALPSVLNSPEYSSRLYAEDLNLAVTLQIDASSPFNPRVMDGLTGIKDFPVTYNAATDTYIQLPQIYDDNIDIFFFYNRNRYTLRFDTLGGASIVTNTGVDYDALKYGENIDKYIPLSEPTRSQYGLDYVFEGWYYDSGYYFPYASGDTMGNNDITLYAKWSTSGYPVLQYDDLTTDVLVGTAWVNRGEYLDTTELVYQSGETYGKGKFLGWRVYLDQENTGWFSFGTPIYEGLSLHAVWDEPGYRVIYVNTDPEIIGTVPEDNNAYIKDVLGRVRDNSGDGHGGEPLSALENREFVGWQINKVGVVYFRNNLVKVDGEIRLYPRFVPQEERGEVVYHSNNSANLTAVQPTAKDSLIQLPDETVFLPTTFPNNQLIGWSLTISGINTLPASSIYNYGNVDRIDMWAVWRYSDTYDITFEPGEYGVLTGTALFHADRGKTMSQSNVTPPEVIADEYHKFIGWTPDFRDSEIVTANRTFVAAYELLPELPPEYITISPFDGVYTGTAHSVAVSTSTGGAIRFSENGTDWSDTNPAFTNVNNTSAQNKYPVWVRYVTSGYQPYVAESYVRITKAALSVTAPSREIDLFDGIPDDEDWILKYDGFVNGEGASDLTGTGTIAASGFAVGIVGDFSVIAGGHASNNYKITYINGLLRVKNADSVGSFTKQVWDEAKSAYVDLLYADSRGISLDYQIKFVLPSSVAGYGGLEIQDLLPDAMSLSAEPGSIELTAVASNGAPLVIRGTAQLKYADVGGGVASYTFSPETDWAALAGATVSMKVRAIINDDAAPGSIINKARLLINEDALKPTLPSAAPVGPSAEIMGAEVVLTERVFNVSKSVFNTNTGVYEFDRLDTNDRSATMRYRIEFAIPADVTSIDSIDVQDVFPVGLEIAYPANPAAAVEFNVDGNQILVNPTKVDYSLINGELTLTYRIDNDLTAYAGKTAALFVDTKFASDIPQGAIVNTAKILVNASNPKVDTGPAVYLVNPVSNLEKKIWDEVEGKYIDGLLDINDRDKVLEYIITFKMPADTSNYENVKIIDELPGALEPAGALSSSLLVTVNGTDVTGLGVLRNDGGAISYEFAEGTDYIVMANADVAMTVRVKARAGAPNGVVFNTAKVVVNYSNVDIVSGPGVVITEPVEGLEKLVYDEASDTYGDRLNVTDRNKPIEYRISFIVPADTTSYSGIEILDILPGTLELANESEPAENVKVYVDDDDVTYAANIGLTNGVVSYLFGEDSDFAELAGKTIVMSVLTKIKQGASNGTIYNVARVLVNGKNPQDVTGPALVVTEPVGDLAKRIYDAEKGDYVDRIEINDTGKVLEYEISFTMPADVTGIESIKLQDIMPAAIGLADPDDTPANVSLIVGGSTVPVAASNLEASNSDQGWTVSYTFGSDTDFIGMAGKTVAMRIKAIVTNPDYTGVIVNTARVSVNGENPVTITEGGVIVTKPIEGLEKLVYDEASDTYGSRLNVTDRDKPIEYRISFIVPADTTSYSGIEILDILPGTLELANESEPAENVKVYVDDDDVTDAANIGLTNGAVSYLFGEDSDFAELAGKTIVMSVLTKIKQGASNGTIYNVARVLVNGKNPQDVTGPALVVTEPVGDLAKRIYDAEKGDYVDRIEINDTGKVLEYEISFTMPTDVTGIESIKIQDIMPAAIGLADPANTAANVSLSVGGSTVAAIAENLEANDSGQGWTVSYTFGSDTDFIGMAGKTVAMRIKAIVTNPDYTGVIVNTARVSVNGENPVTITEGGVVVTKPVTEFRKTVYNPNSGTYGAGLDITTNYDGIIEYRIDFKLPTDTTSYSSIEILDILPGVLELANTVETAENVRIYIDGVDITEASKVSYANGVVGYRLGEGNDFVSLAGKTVVMNVSTRLKQGVSSGTAYNTARVLVNGKNPQNVSGGELNITNPPPIIPGALVSLTKKIYSYDDNEYVDSSYVTDPDEILRYQISFVLPSDMAGYESLEIQDVLPDSLGLYGLIEDSVVIAVNGIAVSGGRLDMKYADIGGGVISYAFDTAAIAALGGKVVTMTIMTKLLPDVVNGSVINKGRVLINEDPGDPTRPGDAPVSPSREVDGPDVIRIDSAKDFSKKVWDGKGYADSFVVPDMDQDLSYQISFVLPADIGGYRSIEIQDLLPSMLELTDSLTDSVIVEVNGVKANENGLSVKYPDSGGGVISYVFSQSEISSMANALVTMTIKTRLVSGAAYGSIENIARLLINEDVGAPTKPEDTPEEPSEEVKGPTVEIYPEYTVIFNGNEGHVVGSTVEYARYPDYMVDSLPRAERTNYRFVEWNSRRDGSGYTFDDETPVSEDITVYALWQYIKPDITDTPGNGEGDDPAPPKTPVVTPAPIEKPPEEVPLQEIQDEPAPLEDAPVAAAVPTPPARTRTAAVVNEEPPIEIIEPIWITPPTISLPDIATPLAMAIPVWSLLNLMLAMLGCLIAIMLLVTSVRRRQDEYEEYRSVQESKFLKILWRVLGILSGLAGLVVFMLTENISNVMVMTDRWTPLMIMIEFAVLVFTFLLYRRGSDKDTDDGVMFDLSE